MKKLLLLTCLSVFTMMTAFAQPDVAPYTQSFDAATIPTNWSQSSTSGGPFTFGTPGFTWNVLSCPGVPLDHTGNGGNYAAMDHSQTDVGVILELNDIDVSALTVPYLSFYYIMCGTFDAAYNVENPTYVEAWDGSNWNIIMTLGTTVGWEEQTTLVTGLAYTGNLIKLRFRAESGGATNDYEGDVALDDISVVEAPSCPEPSVLIASNETSSSVDLTWLSGGAANNIIEYGPTGFTPGTGTTLIGSTTGSATIIGLNPVTSYDWYVQDSCAVSDVSLVAGPGSFQTACLATMAGAYTVGPNITDDFSTLSAAAFELNNCGISAPVTINVAPGTYTESFTLGAIAGSSATNTVTIDGGTAAGTIITSGGNSDNATISLDATEYVTIQNMTIENTKIGVDAWGVYLTNGVENVTIDNCIITLLTSTSSDRAGILSSSSNTTASLTATYGDNASDITVSNCTILNAYYGIRLNGGTSATDASTFNGRNIIENNTIDAYLYGVYLARQNLPTVSGNTVFTTGTSTGMDGIYCLDIMNFEISANTVNVPDYGIYISDGNFDGPATGRALIANNMSQSNTDYAMLFSDLKFTDILHNTCLGDRGFGRSGISSSLTVANNVFVSNNNDFAYYDASTLPDSIYNNFNFNIFETSGTNLFDFGPFYNDLTAFQADVNNAGLNTSSFEGDPLFVSPTDLHLIGTLADGAALSIPFITVDIDGDARTATPDIGADEFLPATCFAPTALTSDFLGSDSVVVSWTAGGTETLWDIEFDTAGYTQGMGTTITGVMNPASITGLMPQTNYDYYVRSSCGGVLSPWAGPFSFLTACVNTLNGAYTIGGPAGPTNFATFADAQTELNICGISGPVIFNVAPGTYSEFLELNDVVGASMVNTITFDGGSSATTVLTSAGGSDNATISLNGTQYTSFVNMTIENTKAGVDAWGVFLTNGVENVTIDNCIITLDVSTSSDRAGVMASNLNTSASAYGDNAEFVTISNCTILNGYYGIRLNGNTSSTVNTLFSDGNIIQNNTIESVLYGIYMIRQDSSIISGNTISRTGTNNGMDGIYCIDLSNFAISGNTVNVPDWGIYISDGNLTTDGTVNGRSIIVNNMAQSNTDYALRIDDVEFTDVFYNTCYGDRGMYVNDAVDLDVRNNIIASNNTDFAFFDQDVSPAAGYLNFDYNLFLTNGTNTFDFGPTYADLAAFLLDFPAVNSNSIEGDPLFVSAINLHLLGALANNVGTPIPFITMDIDGDMRSATTPDIGADEFAPATCFPPTAFSVDFVGSDSAVISWTAGGSEILWDIEYGPTGFGQGNGTFIAGVSNPVSLSSLPVNENLQYYVRSSCSPTDSSVWDGPFTFTTLNANDAGVVANLESSECGSINGYINVEVENFGIDDLIGVDVTVNLTGAITNSFTVTIDTLFASSTENVLIDSINTLAGGIVNFEAYTSLAGDNDNTNDTLNYSMEYVVLPVAPSFTNQNVCANEPLSFNTGMQTQWYEPGTNNIILDDSVLSFTATQDTTFEYAAYTSTSFQVGNTVPPTSSFITATPDWGIKFNTSVDIFINTVVVYPTGTGTIDVSIMDNATETIITTVTGVPVTDGGTPLSANTITLGLSVPASVSDYRMVLTASSGITSLGRGTSQPGPYTSTEGVTILGGSTGSTGTSPSYYWFYDWNVVIPGCESNRETFSVTILPNSNTVIDSAICDGESVMFDGATITTSGTYMDTLIAANTCDSIVTLNLTVNPILTTTIDSSICMGETVMFDGLSLTTTGTYIDTLSGVTSCDSIVTLNLTVNMPTSTTENIAICDGESIMFVGNSITMAGTYTDTTVNANGCDSLVTIIVTVNMPSTATVNAEICSGETYMFAGQAYTATGTYLDTTSNAVNCDSVTTLNLTVNLATSSTLNMEVCQGSSITLPNGTVVSTTGMYDEVYTNAVGCDSTVTYNVTENVVTASTTDVHLCDGATFALPNGTVVSNANTYIITETNSNGCDSLASFVVTTGMSSVETLNVSFCAGDSVMLADGSYASTAGMIMLTTTNATGCDNVITYNVTELSNAMGTATASICMGDSYMFDGQMLTTAGTYTMVTTAANGCDSTVELTLTVNATSSSSMSASICTGETYMFDGNMLTAAGMYTMVTPNANACDSTVTLTLTVNATTSGSISATICSGDSYMFDGNMLTTAGTYTMVSMGANGCDSTTTLTLDVETVSDLTQSANICDGETYAFGTQILSTAGTYTEVFTTNAGCTYNVTLTLTQGNSVSTSLELLLCGDVQQFELANGTIVTTPGIYTASVAAPNGCDTIITYNVSTCVGIFDLENNIGMIAYPNPSIDELNIEFSEKLSSNNSVMILNVLGQVVYAVENTSDMKLVVSTSEFTSGVYYINVTSDNKTSVQSFTVAK